MSEPTLSKHQLRWMLCAAVKRVVGMFAVVQCVDLGVEETGVGVVIGVVIVSWTGRGADDLIF